MTGHLAYNPDSCWGSSWIFILLRDGNQAGGKLLNGRVTQYTDQHRFLEVMTKKGIETTGSVHSGRQGGQGGQGGEELMLGAKEKGTF